MCGPNNGFKKASHNYIISHLEDMEMYNVCGSTNMKKDRNDRINILTLKASYSALVTLYTETNSPLDFSLRVGRTLHLN